MPAMDPKRKVIRALLREKAWKRITTYVEGMHGAQTIWEEEWAKSGLKWPGVPDPGYYTDGEIADANGFELRRMGFQFGLSYNDRIRSTAESLRMTLLGHRIKRMPREDGIRMPFENRDR